MTDAHTFADIATQPDPPTDRDSEPVPERIAPVLQIAAILADYGRHLVATIEHRALWRGFATIAQFFGTANLAVILPHIHRGIMRAAALERMLLERARRGRDLVVPAPRVRASRAAPPPAAPPPESATATHPEPPAAPQPGEAPPAPQPKPAPGRGTTPKEPLTFDNMPSMADIEKQVRRRPYGRTITAICRDLGVSAGLCSGPFWNLMFDVIRFYGGSVGNLVRDMREREKQLDRESWKHPNLGLPEPKREGIERVLGFFIGEPPVDPFRSVAAPGVPIVAAATGPPGA